MDKYNARYQRGDVVEVRPDGYWTGPTAPGYDKGVFLLVTVPGLSFKDAKHYGDALEEDGKIHKRRKYSFSNVTDKQTFSEISKISVTDKGAISAKKISYIFAALLMFGMAGWLLG
jgi:hypothetical protein